MDPAFWKKLWDLNVPAKVRNFLWRASMGFLPTTDMLAPKYVSTGRLCHMCKPVGESVMHAIVMCWKKWI